MSSMMLAMGVGFRAQCSIEELQALIAQGLEQTGLAHNDIVILATHQHKSASPQLRELHERYGWKIRLFSSEQMETSRKEIGITLSHVSQAAIDILGTPSVAEAAALSALYESGFTHPLLRLPLLRSARATIAIAESQA